MAVALIIIGAGLAIFGAFAFSWPLGVIAVGLAVAAVGRDLAE